MDIVERFAQALDDEDYETAAQCLEADAEYDTGKKTIKGIDAILESFKDGAERGRMDFDSVVFLHEIDSKMPSDIRFLDVLVRNGESFTLDHTMHLTLTAHGRISKLRLSYPPGERDRLRTFLSK